MKFYNYPGKKNICGDRIREARLRKRLSQTELCQKLQLAGIGMNRDGLSKIENLDRLVADFEVVIMAEVLEVPVDWLLGIEERRG